MASPTHDAGSDLALIENPDGSRFPEPRVLSRQLTTRFETWLADLRADRTITRPEDTHDAIRRINHYRLRAGEYAAAFASLATRTEGALAEELVEAVGEKTPGEPAGRMTVPDGDGWEIHLSPEYNTDRDFDMSQILTALILTLADERGIEIGDDPILIDFMLEFAQRVMALHRKTAPSVKAVQALATLAGHRGDDTTAATIKSAVSKSRRTYSKTSVDYKAAS